MTSPPVIPAGEAPTPVDGAALLDEVVAFVRRYVAAPSEHALIAVVLWCVHAHGIVHDAFESSPRVAFLSPEPGSGKTRVLEVLELLCPKPMHSLNASAPAIFRTIACSTSTARSQWPGSAICRTR